MAAGPTHRHATAIATPLVALAMWAATQDHALALAGGVGCYTGMFIHPDWDVNHNAPWWRRPYALMIRHRSPLSHCPVIGTLGRLAYLVLPLWVMVELGLLAAGQREPLFYPTLRHVTLGAAWVAGLMISDALHWLLDSRIWRVLVTRRRRIR
jgi:uncharacterized metal-binding protein